MKTVQAIGSNASTTLLKAWITVSWCAHIVTPFQCSIPWVKPLSISSAHAPSLLSLTLQSLPSSFYRRQYGVLHSSLLENIEDDSIRAGTDGYSVLRRPLSRSQWDPNVDPTFEVPTTRLDPDSQSSTATLLKDEEWWQQQKHSKQPQSLSSSSTLPRSTVAVKPEKEEEEQSLDLFQRSLDTLDYPRVLQALLQECTTEAARQIVRAAMSSLTTTERTTSMPRSKALGKSSPHQQSSIRAYQGLTADTVEGAQERYQAVQEMTWLLDGRRRHSNGRLVDLDDCTYRNRIGRLEPLAGRPPPYGSSSTTVNVELLLDLADQRNQVLEGDEISDIVSMMDAMENVQLWNTALQKVSTESNNDWTFVQLPLLANDIALNTTLHTWLHQALDEKDTSRLRSDTFPTLATLRGRVRNLKADILQQLESLVAQPSIQSKLALDGGSAVTLEVGGRLVIPIEARYATSIGIVHDTSRSGKTAYVEPHGILGPTNTLKQAEGELRAEEARMWRLLTDQILANKESLIQSLRALGQLDLVRARVMLGRRWSGVLPQVQNQGVVALRNAKHPILLLRKVANVVVGSDISLGAGKNQGLVLTGPNSGGKTVILKLLGLVALMARGGIPIPADAGVAPLNGSHDTTAAIENDTTYQPRVDFFNPVLADIGDIQSVGGDLSTFSGHMLVCREVLANAGSTALVLMDELGSGTDPAQGVAIAQAVLEALMEAGARVAITTHYMQLKQLAASDDRFSVGGMQFVGGRPTYKLLPGTVGESFAIAVAERLRLPQKVIDRATELLDSETRQMGDLIRDLEDQKAIVDNQVLELEEKKKELERMQTEMKEQQEKLEKKMLNVRREEAKKFAQKLEEKERVLEDVLEKLKSDPSRRIVAKSWDNIKFVKRDALTEAENIPSVLARKKQAVAAIEEASADLVPLSELRDKPELQDGDKLLICKKGPLFGREGVVIKSLGSRVEVRVNNMNISFKLSEVAMPVKHFAMANVNGSSNNKDGKPASKAKAVAKALAEEQKTPGRKAPVVIEESNISSAKSIHMRTQSNTVDVRGCNLEQAKDQVKDKFSACIMSGRSTVYILHGHGSGGVLRDKIRGWLKSEPLVKQYGPADSSDGGNAFTMVQLK
jgi:DNA mismatch repair protein MutS2